MVLVDLLLNVGSKSTVRIVLMSRSILVSIVLTVKLYKYGSN